MTAQPAELREQELAAFHFERAGLFDSEQDRERSSAAPVLYCPRRAGAAPAPRASTSGRAAQPISIHQAAKIALWCSEARRAHRARRGVLWRKTRK
jgi:hypothetical protein